jgi:hypothetical protein
VLGLHGGDLRTTFPLFGRAVLTALDQRRRPKSNGIIVLRRWAQRDG